jgi:hypothetical protein
MTTKAEYVADFLNGSNEGTYKGYLGYMKSNGVDSAFSVSSTYFARIKSNAVSKTSSPTIQNITSNLPKAGLTNASLGKIAEEFNVTYFESELDLSRITFTFTDRASTRNLGRYKYPRNSVMGNAVITINRILMQDETEVKNTLIHEMVHAWQHQTRKEMGHGYSFKHKALLIWKIDKTWKIARTSNCKLDMDQLSNGRQYLIVKTDDRYNFVKNISSRDIQNFKAKGWEVKKNTGTFMNVRHCINSKAVDIANYYYSLESIKHGISSFVAV